MYSLAIALALSLGPAFFVEARANSMPVATADSGNGSIGASHLSGSGQEAGVEATERPVAEAAEPCSDNADIERMFSDDQAARASSDADWDLVSAADAKRRIDVQALLDKGLLCTGNDFYRAAFIFQHGERPEDYLRAHALAVVATSKGHKGASWIAAATLDRYLQSFGQKQIYGTQFLFRDDGTVTQEPYDRALLPDGIRLLSGVPDLAGQEEQRIMIERANKR